MNPSFESPFLLSALVIFALFAVLWLIFLIIDDASIVDLTWGAGFGLVALVLWTLSEPSTYLTVLMLIPVLWSIRYSWFIFHRNLGHGEDARYTEFREKALEEGESWPAQVLIKVMLFQALAMYFVSTAIVVGFQQPQNLGLSQMFGLGISLLGISIEAIADLQLNRFKRSLAGYQGSYEDKPIMDSGIWRYSRHPNYFGNACLWWGIAIYTFSLPWGLLGLLAAAFMNFALIRVTGKANNELRMSRRKAYAEYVARTSGFILWWPK